MSETYWIIGAVVVIALLVLLGIVTRRSRAGQSGAQTLADIPQPVAPPSPVPSPVEPIQAGAEAGARLTSPEAAAETTLVEIPEPVAAPETVATPEPEVAPAPTPEPTPAPKAEPAPVSEPGPALVTAAAVGTVPPAVLPPVAGAPADDLRKIKGVGPKIVALLNGRGVTTYAQIAAWSEADLADINAALGNFAGRPQRDNWVDQAQLLAAGDVQAYEAKYGKL